MKIDIRPVKWKSSHIDLTVKFSPALQKRLSDMLDTGGTIQKAVDEHILQTIEPYTPKDSNELIESATKNTEIGSGIINWVTAYAAQQYYTNPGPPRPKGTLRGAHWIERWKDDGMGGMQEMLDKKTGR